MTHKLVFNAQIVGVPDKRLQNEIGAYLIIKQDQKDNLSESQIIDKLRNHCEGKIANFKIPKYWKILKKMPMTTGYFTKNSRTIFSNLPIISISRLGCRLC